MNTKGIYTILFCEMPIGQSVFGISSDASAKPSAARSCARRAGKVWASKRRHRDVDLRVCRGTGPGAATLHFLAGTSVAHPEGLSLASISATGTTGATTLSFAAHGSSHTINVGTITTDGAFKAIQGPTTNLTGDLSIPGGTRTLSLLSANNGTFTLGGAGAITTLSLGQVNGETITSSGAFDRIQVQFDAGIHLSATSIATMSVGALHDSVLTLSDASQTFQSLIARRGITNTLVNTTGGIGTINTPSILNSTIDAGVGPLPAGQSLPAAPTDFVTPAEIRSVLLGRATGVPSFSNSVLAAASLGNLNLGPIATANNGVPFGVAAHSIASLAGTDATTHRAFRLTRLATPQDVSAQLTAKGLNLQDFVIRIL